jgi:phosphate transport system permease protein
MDNGGIRSNIQKRNQINDVAKVIFFIASLFGVLVLGLLFYQIFEKGLPWLNFDFLTNFPSRSPKKAGLFSALIGSMWVIGFTILLAAPIGVGCALYLEEYTRKNRIAHWIEINISNLAGSPLSYTVFWVWRSS